MTLTPMLFVDDVVASSHWYQTLLGERARTAARNSRC